MCVCVCINQTFTLFYYYSPHPFHNAVSNTDDTSRSSPDSDVPVYDTGTYRLYALIVADYL